MDKNQYRRLNLKNGWDLPKGEKAPLTGRKQELVRAYELLVQKTDEEYLKEAETVRQQKGENVVKIRSIVIPEEIQKNLPFMPETEKEKYLSVLSYGAQLPTVKTGNPELSNKKAENKNDTGAENLDWEAELRDSTDEKWQEKRKRRLQISGMIVAAAVIIIGGRLLLGPSILTADISTYEDVPITIEGLTEEPFTVTPAELAKMKKVSIKVDVHEQELAPDEEPELGKAVGPTLETFLDAYGVNLDDVRSMKVYSESEKSTAYVHTLEENTIILSVANGRVPLHEKEAPLRIAVEDTDADAWSGWIRRIVFTMK